MINALLIGSAVAVMYGAFALFSLSQERHWATVTREINLPQPLPATHVRWRFLGALGLGAGLALCIGSDGTAFGSVLWVMCLALCAVAVALTLAWKPHWLRIVYKFAGN